MDKLNLVLVNYYWSYSKCHECCFTTLYESV